MLDLNGQRIFIAGGAGLAGSGVVRALLAAYPAIDLVVPSRGGGARVDDPRVTYVAGDLREEKDCLALSKGCGFAVMAAANTGGAQASRDAPWGQVTDNVIMDARMLQAFHDNGVKRVVYVSTASVYSPFEGFVQEDDLDWNKDPHDTYLGVGWAKRYGEKLCEFWHKKSGMSCICLRLANVYGPFARFDPAVSNFIAAITRKAVDGMDPFEVWGSANVTRDVVFADDFGEAVAAALAHDDISFDVFNIGSGVKTTVGEVVSWAIEFSGHTPKEVRFGESAPDTLAVRALDISKAKAKLGWSPTTSVRDGMRQTVEWWKRNRGTWHR